MVSLRKEKGGLGVAPMDVEEESPPQNGEQGIPNDGSINN